MKSETLKPCPFCGCEAERFKDYWDTGKVDHVGCTDCGVAFEDADDWNTRKKPVGKSGFNATYDANARRRRQYG